MLKQQYSLQFGHMRGASMVEVLVALVVMGVGMLGIASLYVVTMQAKTASQSRMQAVYLAADMAERIRANKTATNSYAITTISPAPTAAANCFQTASTTATACTAAQLAASDLAQWAVQVSSTLPGNPDGSIAYNNGTVPDTYTITLNWADPSAGNLTYQLEVRI